MAELQKDPITRGDFLGFGLLGAISGAILTIPPVAFVLSPVIKTNVLGQTDIDQGWQPVASIEDLKKLKPGTPDHFEVEFPIEQVYSEKEIQEKFPESQKSSGFSQSERDEILGQLNILSNSCAHLGCPVRWFPEKHEFLCPCHGGLYDINGGYVGGPPPRGMYSYTQAEVREDGTLYIKHGYDIKPGIPGISTQQPYVV